MTQRALGFALVFLLCAGLFARAHANGTVLEIRGNDVYIDLGARDGVGAGSKLTLLHVVVAKDPVTGKTVRDRFPLGTLTVIRAGEHLCIADPADNIRHRVKVGDEIVLASRPRTFEDPWLAAIEERRATREERIKRASTPPPDPKVARKAQIEAARKRAQATVDEAEAVKAVWQKTLGKPPADRITIWQTFLTQRPDSPYAESVRQEIASLGAQIQAEEQMAEQMVDPMSRRAEMRVERLAALEHELEFGAPLIARAPGEVYQGSAVELAFTIVAPKVVDRAWLYYRNRKDDGFSRVQLVRDGDTYLRGTIPATVAVPPGIEYFVEIADGVADHEPVAVIGSQEVPRRIDVQATVEDKPPELRDRSRVTLFTDYVDFDGGLSKGFDQYLHAEIDFMYRFHRPIYALRVGFGTLGGFGGPKDIIDADPTEGCLDSLGNYRCRRVSFSYAYTELEHRFSRNIAVMLRPQFGTGTSDLRPDGDAGRCNTDDINQCDFFSAFGMRARLRIGDERATNLVLGVGVTQNVGAVFEAAYTWSVIPLFPIKLAAQVTDQPVPEDYGVRIIADVGWRAVKWVYPSVRLAYQARDVDHSGISGGVAVNFDW